MQKIILLSIAVLLIAGCKTPEDEPVAFNDNPFNLDILDDEIIPGNDGDFYGSESLLPGDLPLAQGTGMRFVEPDSGMIDPAIATEAKLVLRDVHFPYNSSSILPEDSVILQNISEFMSRFPSVILQIQGYCDERGTEEYNMALGSRRAGSVRQFLADLGVDPNRLYTISYGEEMPINPGHNDSAWAENRRAHFLIGVAGQ